MRSRTPKVLAPLEGRPKVSEALPVLLQHIPLKPISQSPHCSRAQLRDRTSLFSPCNSPPINKAGSEESGSSSNSNQSSISLENDDDERQLQETALKGRTLRISGDGFRQHTNDVISSEEDFCGEKMQHLKIQPRISLVPLVNGSIHNKDRDHHFHKEKPKNHRCEANNVNYTKEFVETESSDVFICVQKGDVLISENNETHITAHNRAPSREERNMACMTKLKTEISHIADEKKHLDDGMTCSRSDKNERLIEETTRNESCDNKTDAKLNKGTTEEKTMFFAVNTKRTFNAQKSVRNKERRNSMNGQLRKNIQINSSFKMLGHKNPNNLGFNKSKIKMKYPEVSTDVKDKITKSPDMTVPLAKEKLKIKSVSGAGFSIATPIPCKVSELSQSNTSHQQVSVRELKSDQKLKKTHVGGKNPRSKSAVDLITNKDSFQQIQNDDVGPAVYEMFAGPIFENLQISSSCEKQLLCAATQKTKQGHNVKPGSLKMVQKLKQSSGETTTTLNKIKPKSSPPRVKPHFAVMTKKPIWNTESAKLQAEPLSSEDTDGGQDESEDQASPTMKEAASKYGSDTLRPEETLTTSASFIYVVDYTFMQNHKTMLNTSTQNSDQQVSEVSLLPSSQQPKINTWKSSTRNTVMSPVYQKFLDEVGDGPLTDDLLQCLAEELISLDERDASTGSENPKQKRKEFNQEQKLEYLNLPCKFPEVYSLICKHFLEFVMNMKKKTRENKSIV